MKRIKLCLGHHKPIGKKSKKKIKFESSQSEETHCNQGDRDAVIAGSAP